MPLINLISGEQSIWDASTTPEETDHGEGHALVHDFLRAVAYKDPSLLSTTIQKSMVSHLMGFKAEDSRIKGTIEKVGM